MCFVTKKYDNNAALYSLSGIIYNVHALDILTYVVNLLLDHGVS